MTTSARRSASRAWAVITPRSPGPRPTTKRLPLLMPPSAAALLDGLDVGEGPVQVALVLPAAEQGAGAEEQLALVDRLGQVIVGAGLDGALDVGGLVEGSGHEDGDVAGGGVGAQALADLEA